MPNGPSEAQQCLQDSEHLLRARYAQSERSWKHCWNEKPGRANKNRLQETLSEPCARILAMADGSAAAGEPMVNGPEQHRDADGSAEPGEPAVGPPEQLPNGPVELDERTDARTRRHRRTLAQRGSAAGERV